MRRREFIKVVGTAAVTWPFVARAQEPGRTYRLGLLLARIMQRFDLCAVQGAVFG